MKRLACTILLVFSCHAYSQVDVSAGMGINFLNAQDLFDYINYTIANPAERVSSFNASVEFYGEAGTMAGKDIMAALGYGYGIYSYNTAQSKLGKYDLYLNTHSPTLIAYYVIPGPGYKLKLGGGVGYRLVYLQERFGNFDINYKASGLGFMLKADGNTSLGGELYANLGLLLKWDLPGKPENTTALPQGFNTNIENVSLNSFAIGVRLGLSYFF